MDEVLLFLVVIAINLTLIKFHIPILELPIGVFSIVYGMMETGLPYFPFINLIVVVIGIGSIMDAIDELK